MITTQQLYNKMPMTMKHNFMVVSRADFFDCYYWIYENMSCHKAKQEMADIIFPLFEKETGRKFDSEWFTAFGIKNPL